MERLQKVIAQAGLASRRAAEELIREGRVAVNGHPAHLGQKIDVTSDAVTVDGVALPVAPDQVYYLLNKPRGVVTTVSDPQGRRTVIDLVPHDVRVVPVGRLDINTSGLLILTNDGELTLRLTHPRYGVRKRYVAQVEGDVGAAACRQLREGVQLDDGIAKAAEAAVIDRNRGATILELVLAEGRKREVRRMLEAIGHRVQSLHRTHIGPLVDPELAAGQWRVLSGKEVRDLYAAAGHPTADD